ncbi:MAG: hypothetical protein IJ003_00880 [Candidatus Gastranaerophilales bacterium]|nr:hypothetical protein [Candidatus Gastranaerophilales bacterium]
MKKTLLALLSGLFICGCGICATSELDILTLFSTKSNSPNKLWVGTFQLVFNDMKNNILKKDVIFVKERQTAELKGLNKEEFNKDMLNESSYYTSYGEVEPAAKEKIQKDIKEKFNETSDIIDTLDWTKRPDNYYAYAMLKKEFEFNNEFDKLEKASFNNSKEEYEFFGIRENSDDILNKNLDVLFYNNMNDYAVKLLTKTGDEVYLYRTESNSNFKKLYSQMQRKERRFKGKEFGENDTLKVPNLKIKDEKKYPQLCNKQIKGTNFYFSEAIETIQFDLDNKGGKVKSEAALIMKSLSLPHIDETQIRHFDFDKTFVLFLVDSNKKDPYLALRIKDLKGLTK